MPPMRCTVAGSSIPADGEGSAWSRTCTGALSDAEISAEPDEDLRTYAFALAHQAEQEVLGADVVVAELERFA